MDPLYSICDKCLRPNPKRDYQFEAEWIEYARDAVRRQDESK
jgi:hypothetical protein